MEVDVLRKLWLNRWHHAPLARSCRRLWRHRRLFRHEMRMERRRRSEFCSAHPHCSALNVNVFILGVDSLTTKTAKTMITAALMMVMSRKRRVRGWPWPWRAQPRKWRRTRTDADGPWHARIIERIITLDLDAIQPDRGSTKSARPHSGVRPSVGIINMTCLFSVDSMRDVDGTERV